MFRAPLCPSSGVKGCTLLHMVSACKVLAGVLGRREPGRVLSVDAVFRLESKNSLYNVHTT